MEVTNTFKGLDVIDRVSEKLWREVRDIVQALQYSYLENSVDRGVWWAAVHGGAQSWTRLK